MQFTEHLQPARELAIRDYTRLSQSTVAAIVQKRSAGRGNSHWAVILAPGGFPFTHNILCSRPDTGLQSFPYMLAFESALYMDGTSTVSI